MLYWLVSVMWHNKSRALLYAFTQCIVMGGIRVQVNYRGRNDAYSVHVSEHTHACVSKYGLSMVGACHVGV